MGTESRRVEVTGVSSCFKSGDDLVRLVQATGVLTQLNMDLGFVTSSSGLKYRDLMLGFGPSPAAGDTAVVDYTLWLEDCTWLESSPSNEPFQYVVGTGQVIQGFEEGVAGMKVGGTRLLIIPPHLAFGEMGVPPIIPPNATLIFEVELLDLSW